VTEVGFLLTDEQRAVASHRLAPGGGPTPPSSHPSRHGAAEWQVLLCLFQSPAARKESIRFIGMFSSKKRPGEKLAPQPR